MWRFLFRNLRGSRVIVGFAVSLTFIQVAADILTAFPLKFILDKVVHHIDPVVPVVGGLLSRLDPLGTRNGLNDNEVHTQMGVLLFSTVLLLGLSVTSAVLSYIQVLIATALLFSVPRDTVAIDRAAKVMGRAAAEGAEVATEDSGATTEVKPSTPEEGGAERFRRYGARLWAASWRSGRLQAEFTPI